MSDDVIRIGLLGCGTVGGALIDLVAAQRDEIEARTGLRLEVTRVAVRSLSHQRTPTLPAELLTTDAAAVVTDPDIDVIVELIGGIEPARDLILDALKAGKPVVSANKELVANLGDELFVAADAACVDFLFEASVAGGIPLLRALRESLAGERVDRVMGIVNGTTNFILTRMTEDAASYEEALAEAQRLGFAERDPTADVEGFDAAAKAAIIATIAFGVRVVAGDVYREGISAVTADDIAYARRLGYVIKLLAVAERHDDEIAVRVHPAMIPAAHPLAAVRDSFNAVFVEGDAVGDLMFYGRGAGGRPTASAVLGDIIDVSANLRRGTHRRLGGGGRAKIRPVDLVSTEYYLNIDVQDRPGVLAAVAQVFGAAGISIRSMEQQGLDDEARLIFITHRAQEGKMQQTLAALRELEAVDRVNSLLRVVGAEVE